MEEAILISQIEELANSRFSLALATLVSRLSRQKLEIEALTKENQDLRNLVERS